MKPRNRFLLAASVMICSMLTGSVHAASGRPVKPSLINLFKTDSIGSFDVRLVQLENSTTIRLTVVNLNKNTLFITLRDPSGYPLHVLQIFKGDTRVEREYNFVGAEEGTYELDISDKHHKEKKEIKLKRVHQEDITMLSIR